MSRSESFPNRCRINRFTGGEGGRETGSPFEAASVAFSFISDILIFL